MAKAGYDIGTVVSMLRDAQHDNATMLVHTLDISAAINRISDAVTVGHRQGEIADIAEMYNRMVDTVRAVDLALSETIAELRVQLRIVQLRTQG